MANYVTSRRKVRIPDVHSIDIFNYKETTDKLPVKLRLMVLTRILCGAVAEIKARELDMRLKGLDNIIKYYGSK